MTLMCTIDFPPPHRASIEKYLLEKSRIVSQAPEERNYHVFYYLLSGADAETKAELQLMDMDKYEYLTQVSLDQPAGLLIGHNQLMPYMCILRAVLGSEFYLGFLIWGRICHNVAVELCKQPQGVHVGVRDLLHES